MPEKKQQPEPPPTPKEQAVGCLVLLVIAGIAIVGARWLFFSDSEPDERTEAQVEAAIPVAPEEPVAANRGRAHVRELTKLGRKAKAVLHSGMPRSEVILALGPPTWVRLTGDKGPWGFSDPTVARNTHILMWANGDRLPVLASFGPEDTLQSWDPGVTPVGFPSPITLPDSGKSCARPSRAPFCDPNGVPEIPWPHFGIGDEVPEYWLRPGFSYRATVRLPIVPSMHPKDPMAAIKAIRYAPPNAVFAVLVRKRDSWDPWYAVELRGLLPGRMAMHGWINSVALMGPEAKVYRVR